MPTQLSLYVGNSNVAQLALTDGITEAAITGATVSCTLYDQDGAEVSGQVWPLTLTHVAAGVYRGTMDESIGIVAGRRYRLAVTAISGSLTYLDTVQCLARTRER